MLEFLICRNIMNTNGFPIRLTYLSPKYFYSATCCALQGRSQFLKEHGTKNMFLSHV